MRKKNFKKGKGKGKFKKGKKGRFHHGRHIRAASYDDDEASGSEEDVQESNSDVITNIRSLMKGMTADQRTNTLLSLADKDF